MPQQPGAEVFHRILGARGKAAAEIRQLRGEPEADPYLLLHDGDSFFCVDEVTFRPMDNTPEGKSW